MGRPRVRRAVSRDSRRIGSAARWQRRLALLHQLVGRRRCVRLEAALRALPDADGRLIGADAVHITCFSSLFTGRSSITWNHLIDILYYEYLDT